VLLQCGAAQIALDAVEGRSTLAGRGVRHAALVRSPLERVELA
jgi:hypothetical protein